MFRFKVGTKILVRKNGWTPDQDSIEVKILAKVPRSIKVEVLSDGWFHRGEIRWLNDNTWFALARVSPD